jgi:membrane carboxypeptidase/penicillin-binding protein
MRVGGARLAQERIARSLRAVLKTFQPGGACEAFIREARLEIRIDAAQIDDDADLMVACRRQERRETACASALW